MVWRIRRDAKDPTQVTVFKARALPHCTIVPPTIDIYFLFLKSTMGVLCDTQTIKEQSIAKYSLMDIEVKISNKILVNQTEQYREIAQWAKHL